MNARTTRTSLLAAMCATCLLGCAADAAPKKSKYAAWDIRRAAWWNNDEKKPDPEIPTRLVATWTEAVLNQSGEKPKRGFGGRITFFKRDSKDAIRVDGQLVVYAFDETTRQPHETQPTRKYIFPAEEVVRHEGESAMGPSYSFWLPWDEAGGPQRNIKLIPRFEPKGGAIVLGEQTEHFLPGASVEADQPQLTLGKDERSALVNSVRLAGYSKLAEESAAPTPAEPAAAQPLTPTDASGRPKLSIETIALPPRLGAAMQQSPSPSPGNSVTTFDPRMTGNLPLSQLASMGLGRQTADQAPAAAGAGNTVSASAVAPTAEATSPAGGRLGATAAGRGAGSPRSYGSQRESLPALARQPALRGPVRGQ